MNKKGFTLIELLAVIVILAIISVIAIPRILNVVDESKKGAAESSALGYIDAVEKQNMINSVKETATIPDGTYDDIDEFNQTYNIQVKGSLPTAGSITITNGKVAEAAICISGYTVAYNGTKATVGAKCSDSTVTCYQPNEVIFSDGTPGPTSITPTCTGRYKLEVWGASGGDANSTYKGGYGGYSVGEIVLQKGVTVYINIGGAGSTNNTSTATGGANGGGSTYETRSETFEGSGGGATHIAYEPGDLSALGQFKGTLVNNEYYSSERIIIVAGGGGGGSYYTGGNYSGVGGQGGGKKGTQGTVLSGSYGGTGGTQTAGGTISHSGTTEGTGAFGLGGSNTGKDSTLWGQSGGGGGFYGGAISHHGGAGGGSGYIANPNLTNKKMVMFTTDDNYVSNDVQTKTEKTDQVSANAESNKAKSGNGYAKITYLGN